MKELSSFNAVGYAATGGYGGRVRRKATGDLPAGQAFKATLDRSKTGTAGGGVTTSSAGSNGRSSNASILAAIGARNVSGAERAGQTNGGTRTPTSTGTPTTPSTPTTPTSPTNPSTSTPRQFSSLQQNWLDSNTGVMANLMKANLSRSEDFQIDEVAIQWVNGSSGKPEAIKRAVGNISTISGTELASLLGGTLVSSPFNTFGTTQRDQYIRMPNGQMIEASVLANQLNAARTASDPFSATQSVLDQYKLEMQQFDLAKSTNAIDLATKGMITTSAT